MAANGVSIGMACRQLGVSAKELRAMMADGRLRYRRVNGGLGKPSRIIIDSSDIARLLRRTMGPPSPTALATVARLRRMGIVASTASTKKEKRPYDILQSWTGEDLRAKGYFTGICKNVKS
jgi:hypothetical protein